MRSAIFWFLSYRCKRLRTRLNPTSGWLAQGTDYSTNVPAFKCAKTMSDLDLLKPPEWRFERNRIPRVVVNISTWRKTTEPLEVTKLPTRQVVRVSGIVQRGGVYKLSPRPDGPLIEGCDACRCRTGNGGRQRLTRIDSSVAQGTRHQSRSAQLRFNVQSRPTRRRSIDNYP